MITEQTRVFQNPRTAARVIEGKAVVIVIDKQKLHTLNEVGTFIWNQAEGKTVQEISQALVEHFDVDAETSLKDTLRFTKHLHDAQTIQLDKEVS